MRPLTANLALLLGLFLLAACAARMPVGAPPTELPPNVWCFSATVNQGGPHEALGCADTEELCGRALEMARTWGKSIAHVQRLGACERFSASEGGR